MPERLFAEVESQQHEGALLSGGRDHDQADESLSEGQGPGHECPGGNEEEKELPGEQGPMRRSAEWVFRARRMQGRLLLESKIRLGQVCEDGSGI